MGFIVLSMNSKQPRGALIGKTFGETKHYQVGADLTAMDCKILNAVAAKLIEFGAASVERLQSACKLEAISVKWALCWLGAECGSAELYYLPE